MNLQSFYWPTFILLTYMYFLTYIHFTDLHVFSDLHSFSDLHLFSDLHVFSDLHSFYWPTFQLRSRWVRLLKLWLHLTTTSSVRVLTPETFSLWRQCAESEREDRIDSDTFTWKITMVSWRRRQIVVWKIQLFRSRRTNIPQQRDVNCINFTCLTKGPHDTI